MPNEAAFRAVENLTNQQQAEVQVAQQQTSAEALPGVPTTRPRECSPLGDKASTEQASGELDQAGGAQDSQFSQPPVRAPTSLFDADFTSLHWWWSAAPPPSPPPTNSVMTRPRDEGRIKFQ
jgi:hypothetical protein